MNLLRMLGRAAMLLAARAARVEPASSSAPAALRESGDASSLDVAPSGRERTRDAGEEDEFEGEGWRFWPR